MQADLGMAAMTYRHLQSHPVAWMTEDGRVVNAHSKATCGNSSLDTFTIPLYLHPAESVIRKEIERLTKENDFLHAYTGNSDKACVYCGLGADEQGQCQSGFPGCARGDDQMLCREVGVGLERDELRKLLLDTVHPTQFAVIPPGWIERRDALLGPRSCVKDGGECGLGGYCDEHEAMEDASDAEAWGIEAANRADSE